MVLLFNVFLTEVSGNNFIISYERGNLNNSNKLEITKYALASLAVAYPWTKVILNIELDDKVYSEKDYDGLRDFIDDEFKGMEVVFSPKRATLQEEWLDIYSMIDDDFILYLGNHDHVFIDSDNYYFSNLLSKVKERNNDYSTIVTSHWPENIRWAKSGYIDLNETNPRKLNSNYKIEDDFISYTGICIDSLNIITKKLFHDWFSTGDWGDTRVNRTDGVASVGSPSIMDIRSSIDVPLPEQEIIIPLKEQFRHFDSYMHQKIANDICPSLSIPDGFFESCIKVRYGYDDHKEGWVNINPKKPYYAADINGVEDRITIEDLPLFWGDRIIDIDINSNHDFKRDEEEMIQYRLQGVLSMIYSDERYNPYIDKEVETKVISKYLEAYKEYQLDG